MLSGRSVRRFLSHRKSVSVVKLPIEAGRNYKVAGWATVGSQAPGPAIWDVVAEYLGNAGVARVDFLNTPVLRGVGDNLGLADYSTTG